MRRHRRYIFMLSEKSKMAAELIEAALAKVSKQETEYITYDEACEIAKVSRWRIMRWIKSPGSGIIAIKLGSSRNSSVRIEKASFLAYLASYTVTHKKEMKK